MTCPLIGRLLRRGALVLAFVPVVWVLMLALMPTGWVRARLIASISSQTSQTVRLDEVRIGPLGGLRLRGLELSEPGREHHPWLTADRVVVLPKLGRLAAGRIEADMVQIDGVTVRAERLQGGRFPFADLLMAGKGEEDEGSYRVNEAWQSRRDTEHEVEFQVRNAKLTLLDEPTGTRLMFSGIAGHGVYGPERASLQLLHGTLNKGRFDLEAEMERAGAGSTFEIQLKGRGIVVGEGMNLLSYIVPILSRNQHELESTMDLNLYLRGEGDSLESLVETVVGQGAVVLDPVELRDSAFMTELSQALQLPDRVRLCSVRSDFGIAKGRIISNEMVVDTGGIPFVLSGCTDFHGNVDYRVRSQALREAIAPYVAELPIAIEDVVELRVKGPPGHLSVTVEGIPLRDAHGNPLNDRERIRELGRLLRDRVLR